MKIYELTKQEICRKSQIGRRRPKRKWGKAKGYPSDGSEFSGSCSGKETGRDARRGERTKLPKGFLFAAKIQYTVWGSREAGSAAGRS